MKKDMVLWANADSFWTVRYIENVLIPLKIDFCLFTLDNTKYRDFYKEKEIPVYELCKKKRSGFLKILSSVEIFIRAICKLIQCNPRLINVQQIYSYVLKIIMVPPFRKKTIFTFWGSDLFRADDNKMKLISKNVLKCSAVVVISQTMKDRILELVPQIKENSIHVIDMGNSVIKYIDEMLKARAEIRKSHGIGENKTVVMVGYNASPAHQHDLVINVLQTLSAEVKERLFLVVPMTYAKFDQNYVEKVKKLLSESGMEYVVPEEFLDDRKMAELATLTDVFINTQKTDSFSDSMKEQLCAESIMIKGKWLQYDFLDERGVDYVTINEISEIREVLKAVLNEEVTVDTKRNHDILIKEFSWDNSREAWEKLLG